MNIVDEIFTVLRDHCTCGDEGRNQFLRRASQIVEGSTLQIRNPDVLWAAMWEKPFYSGVRSATATSAVNTAKAAGIFKDYRELCSNEWDIKLTNTRAIKVMGTRPQELIDQGVLTGMCAAGFRLATVVALARCLNEIVEANNQVFAAVSSGDSCAFATVRELASPLATALSSVPGIARTTALHIMADLGYPLPKTDIWVCRYSSTDPGVRKNALDNHDIDLATIDATTLKRKLYKYEPEIFEFFDRLTVEHCGQPTGVVPDLNVMFRRYRFVDLMIAKFGMAAEESFGLYRSGVQALKEDSSLRTRYPELAAKAMALPT